MKKILASIAMMAICSTASYAQDVAKSDDVANKNEMARKEKIKDSSPEQKRRIAEMSPERKQRMMERRERFKSLSPEKQQAAKAEMKRHREAMHNITGEEFGGRHRNEKADSGK